MYLEISQLKLQKDFQVHKLTLLSLHVLFLHLRTLLTLDQATAWQFQTISSSSSVDLS